MRDSAKHIVALIRSCIIKIKLFLRENRQRISDINTLYEKHLDIACGLVKSSNIVDIINVLFKYPVTTGKTIHEMTKIPMTSINRYLGMLTENNILYTDNKSRNRTYYYYDLLDILRD